MTIAEKIRMLARRRGLAMQDIAAASGQSRQNLSNKMSRDDFKTKELVKIASAMGCDLIITFRDRATGEEI